ncbi:peptidylprolyl isomerase [Moraxella sp. ZY200743]|uniref:peptidylprolyl isomerase n=1 Tax=Moraxella sp. ZY200743 TaxID=2911970 RepID=UPI003D7EC939
MQGKFLIRPLLMGMLATATLGVTPMALANISISQGTDGIIAVVNDEIILKSELVAAIAALNAQYRANNINATSAQIQHAALDALIVRKLQMGIINRAGVTPNEEVINRQLLEISHAQGLKSLSELQATLDAKQKGSYAALRNQLIEDGAITALWQHQMSNRINISDQEIEAFLKSPEAASIKQSQYHLVHIRIPYRDNANSQDKAKAHDVAKEVAVALQSGKSLGMILNQFKDHEPQLQGADTGLINQNAIPRQLAPQITTLAAGETTNPIVSSTGIDVVKVVEKSDGSKVIMPEWQTSHILVRVDDNQNAALAEQKINALYNELQKGANFAQLAATYSDDTGSAQQQGSLGWVSENQMVPEFEAVMKNTEKGDYSTPFRSQFGWHILKVDNIRERDVTSQVHKNIAREIIFERIAPQAQEDWIQEMKASAYIKIFE